jgi:sulfur carrier protein
MNLIINGEERSFESGNTLTQILKNLGIEDKVMACAVNMDIVKKEQWESYQPNDGDKVELLHFVGGG